MLKNRVAIFALALLVASCTSGESTSSTTELVASSSTTTTTTTIPIDPLELIIDELVATTEELRELEFVTPPSVVFVTDEELADRVRLLIEDELDPEETHWDELLLEVLGLIADDVDLATLYSDLYSEQVAGFYDGETAELVVPADDGELSELQRLTLVHELTHALTDQHFGFADEMIDLDDAQLFEEVAAFTAVVEGDASVTETLYLESLPRESQLEVLTSATEIDTAVFARSPRFIQELLLFPYTTGADFVASVWERGGFDAVNDLYSVAPTTTEHVFHPVDFIIGEESVVVEVGSFVPEGYEVAESSVWGQAAFRAMFGQALDDALATAAAVGWGGDSYRLLWDGADQIVFDLAYAADSTVDTTEMYEALVAFVAQQVDGEEVDVTENRYEVAGEDFALVSTDEETIRLVIATDPDIGRIVVAQELP